MKSSQIRGQLQEPETGLSFTQQETEWYQDLDTGWTIENIFVLHKYDSLWMCWDNVKYIVSSFSYVLL